jgi:hypothetical protein
MGADRQEDLERGMHLIPRLSEVMEDEADEGIRSVYEDVRVTLRVPFVNFIFRVLANYPGYIIPVWRESSPLFRTLALERTADELRAKALLEPVPGIQPDNIVGPEESKQIRDFTDTIHYVLPKLLLVATVFDETLEGSLRPGAEASGDRLGQMEPGVAEGTSSVPMVPADRTTGELREVFEEIRDRHGHPGVASYYRSLGNWPTFLRTVWEAISPVVGSTAYEERERERELVEWASAAVRGLPAPPVEPPVSGEEAAEIRHILAVFRFRIIPDLLMDVSSIKAMLDGTGEARSSRFSAAR